MHSIHFHHDGVSGTPGIPGPSGHLATSVGLAPPNVATQLKLGDSILGGRAFGKGEESASASVPVFAGARFAAFNAMWNAMRKTEGAEAAIENAAQVCQGGRNQIRSATKCKI